MTPMKALLHYRASPGFRARIAEHQSDWLRMVVVDESDRQTFLTELADTDILLHVLEPVTADDIARAPRLRLIQKIGVGVNTIALEAAENAGIAVANMPGTNSRAVAELTLMLMLAACRRAIALDRATRGGTGWQMPPDVLDTVSEIHGKTVGLIGYGAVPRLLAPILKAMGAQVLYVATGPKSDAAAEWRDLPDLIAQSDIVSLHVPQTEDTAGMIDSEMIARFRPGAILINTARGGLVDEPALIDALQSGHVAAAGLDVFASEPADDRNPLFDLENVVVTPHVAWLTPETLDRSLTIAFENCRRLRDGEPLLHRVI